jgi:hypothetical protein
MNLNYLLLITSSKEPKVPYEPPLCEEYSSKEPKVPYEPPLC